MTPANSHVLRSAMNLPCHMRKGRGLLACFAIESRWTIAQGTRDRHGNCKPSCYTGLSSSHTPEGTIEMTMRWWMIFPHGILEK